MIKRIPNVSRFIGRLGFALVVLTGALSHAAAPAAGAPYWIKNTGQWPGDFQFKCEIGNTTYYVTPKGMTVDFREVSEIVAPSLVGKNPQVPFDPSVVILNEVKDPSEKNVSTRGHVIQIHYTNDATRRQVSSPAPPTESSDVPPRFSGGARGGEKLPHYSNYFFGKDSSNWRSRVPHYQTVVAEQVWPGINVEYRADQQGVETIYHVSPGADPTQIQIDYLGLDAPLRIDAQGNLNLTTSLGEVKEQAPYAYQMDGRTQKRVESTYRIIDDNRVSFEFEGFDASKELVVDPLLYGTYLGGGSTDFLYNICTAPNGGVYVAGHTYALSGFPTSPGAYDETGLFPGSRDFVSHFGSTGEFLASTLFGEIQTSENRNTEGGVTGLAYDPIRECVWTCGNANPGWPLTPDALDTTIDNLGDAFLLRLSSDLETLEYCTYFGGNSRDQAYEIALDDFGMVHIAGGTYSTDFPVTPDAFFSELRENDDFLLSYDPSLNEIIFSTYFGGSDVDFAIQTLYLGTAGHVWFCGETYSSDIPVTGNAFQSTLADSNASARDAYITMVTLNPPTIEYCSYLGGNDHDYITALQEMDSAIYIAGRTRSSDFPVTPGAFDTSGHADNNEGFIARLEWESGEYIGTFIGGVGSEFIFSQGNWVDSEYVLVAGATSSADFPVTHDAYDSLLNQNGSGSEFDGFVTKLNSNLSQVIYSTYIGGFGDDEYAAIWIENSDSVWLAGTTLSTDLPTTPDALQPGGNALTSGFVQHFAIDTTGDTTSASHNAPVPNDFTISVYPNPFNPATTISFYLPNTSDVELAVHDVLGREVTRQHLGRLNGGQHEYHLDGSTWASGIYFVTLDRNSIRTSVKIALVK